MTINYNGKDYTVGNRYVIKVSNYHLKESNEDTCAPGVTKIRAKLVLKRYCDGEMYGTDYHYGFVFEYPRTWNGVVRIDEVTLPDGLEKG